MPPCQDHARLQEEITNAISALAECEEALQYEQPKVFTEWSSATEAHRAIMQVRPRRSFGFCTG
jgi:hypothetical protein